MLVCRITEKQDRVWLVSDHNNRRSQGQTRIKQACSFLYHKAGELLMGDLFPPLHVREHVQSLIKDLALRKDDRIVRFKFFIYCFRGRRAYS